MFKRKSQSENRNHQNRDFPPLTKQVLIEHIPGEKTVGIYPLLKNDTCYFLAVDFDKKNWKKDVTAFAETCKMNHIPYHIERSRSGEDRKSTRLNSSHVAISYVVLCL